MGKRLLVLVLALLLLTTGCSTRDDGESPESSGASPETSADSPFQPIGETESKRTPPTDETVMSMDDYSASMVVYTFYFSNMRESLVNQARQNGYTDENMDTLWDVLQEGVSIRDMLNNRAIEVTKEHAILYSMAEKAGTKANADVDKESDEQVDTYLEEVDGDEQAFVNKYFVTPEQMKAVFRRINLVNQYQEGIFEATEVTDDEVKEAHEKNKDFYELVRVRHILITADDTMTEEQKKEAEEKANDILKRIQGGEEIGKLAAEFSEDPGSKDNEGEYIFGKGQMMKEFEDWAFSAKVGDQGIVQTPYGYHVMELMADSSYESVKSLVENDLKIDKAQLAFEKIPELVASDQWVISQDSLDALIP